MHLLTWTPCLTLAVDAISVDELESLMADDLSQGRSSDGPGKHFSSPTSFIC